MQTAARTGSHEAQVATDLRQLHSQTLQSTRIADVSTSVGRSLYEVVSSDEALAGELAEVGSAKLGKAGSCIQASTDGGAAHIDFVQQVDVAAEVEDFLLKVVGICVELLSEGHRHGILDLGTTHLDVVLVLVSLITECRNQAGEGTDKLLVHQDESQTERSWICIVGRLSAVHVVVGRNDGVLAALVAENLECAVGNHLVGIHVDRCAGAALHHVNREFSVELAVDDFAAGLLDGTRNLVTDYAQGVVGLDSGQLDIGDGLDKFGEMIHSARRNLIVVDRTLCLHAVVCGFGYFEFADKVRLNTVFYFTHR